MRIRVASFIVLVAGLAVIAVPSIPAFADRGADDTQQDDRGGRNGFGGHSSDDNSTSGSNSGGGSQAQSAARELRFVARMSDSGGTRVRTRYQERAKNGRALRQSFDVEIKFAQPGEQFEVRVDGRVVGTATANGLGIAKLELRRIPSGPNEVPIPSDFPRLRTGAVITVGAMSGSLSAQ